MITLIRICIAAIVLSFTSLNAQSFQGEATYKTKRKVDLKIDSTNTSMTPDIQKQMNEMLKKQFERTFLLTFNKEESIYKEDVELEAPGGGGMNFNGITIKAFGSGGSDILYKNTKNGSFVNQNEVFGKVFLIRDQLEPREWKLDKDTKNIGEYICYKASYTEQVESRVSGWGSELEESEPETKLETRTVTAWYTPQIPVSNGPQQYQGLPGLILEIKDGDLQIVCSKIVLNPKDKAAIKIPKQGKEVTQKKFDEIIEKKMKEMEERYRSTGRESGETIQFSIGG